LEQTGFKGIQRTFNHTQINEGNIDDVFPLLCPVREKDWLEGWDYTMVKSVSGLIEKNCVFTTPHRGELDTIWYVTRYDPGKYKIEFLRVTPGENVVRINIELEPVSEDRTRAFISYQYTALNEAQNRFIMEELVQSFTDSMTWWEKAINHYLTTGEKLRRKS
jgi:hypothetical protein